jgi:hypothetical protein
VLRVLDRNLSRVHLVACTVQFGTQVQVQVCCTALIPSVCRQVLTRLSRWAQEYTVCRRLVGFLAEW